jgi:sporulation-control protein spo0M
MSFGPSRVDLLTALSVDWAIDPRDQDPIDIQPGPLAERTHQALRVLGFELSRASLVMWRNGTWRQEVVFRPAVEPWTSRLDEVGLVFIPGALRIEIWLEIDRASLTSRPPGDGDRIGLDWPREAFPADPEQIAAELDRTLRQYTAEG